MQVIFSGIYERNIGFIQKVILSACKGRNGFLLRLGVMMSVVLLAYQGTNAATYYSRTSGNWNDPIWSTSATGGTTGTANITSSDNVIIQNGHGVTVNVTANCASLTINGGGTNTYVAISLANSLSVTNGVTINAATANNITRYIAVGAGTLTCSSVTMAAPTTSDTRDSYISVSTGTINVSGNITMNGAAARNQIVMTGSGTLNVMGTGTISGGTISSVAGGYTALTNGTVNYSGTNQTVGNYVYYNLGLINSGTKTLPATLTTINGNFTVDNCTATAQSALTIGGNVVLANGYNMTWGAFTHNVGGSWTRTGYGSSTFTGSTINFNGTTAATISENPSSNTFENITISKSGTLALGANLAIAGSLTINSGSTFNLGGNNLTVGGDVTLNSGSIWNESSAGTYSFAGNFTNNATTFTTSTGTHNFTGSSKVFSGSKATSIPNLTLSGSYTNSGTLTVDNTFGGNGSLTNTGTLNIGGTAWNINLTANAVGNTVNYTGASGQTLRPNSYYNLTLVGGGTKTFPSAIAIANELFIFSGTLAELGSNFVHTANTLNLNGTVQASNTYGGSGSSAAIINSSYFTANTGIVNTANTWTGATNTDWNTASNWSKGVVPTASVAAFVPNVTNQPVVNSTAVCAALNVLSGSSVTLNGSNSLTVSGNINNTGTITLNSGTLDLTGSFTNSGTLNTNTGTVVYSGAAQTVANVNYYNLTLSGSGTKTLQTGTTSITGNLTLSGTASVSAVTGLAVTGDVTLGAGTTLSDAGKTITLAGNWANNGSSYSATGTLKMTGAAKTIGGSGSSVFNNLTLENNASPVLLGANAIVNSTLTLNGGILKLGSYNLTLSSAATISSWYLSSSAMVVADGTGELRRIYSGIGSFTFPIGDNSDGGANYTPVTVNVTSGTFSAAYVGARVADTKHPNNGSTDNYLTRYWSISQSGITGMVANVSATYLPEDIVGSEAVQSATRYASSMWTDYSTLGSNTLTASGVSSFGDFTGFKVQKLYRSKQSGNWNTTSTWEYSADGVNWGAASFTPSSSDDDIIIQNGHTVTVTSGVSIDQTVINAGGQLTVNAGVTLTIVNGVGTDLIVYGTLANAGTISTTGTLAFQASSVYQHTTNGGTIPTATWDVSSNCLITGATGTAPSGLTQTFGNFTWNCAGQTADLSLGGGLNTIAGNFTVQSTNASSISLGGTGAGNLLVSGNYVQTGGVLRGNYSQANGANRTMTITGNFTVSGGTFDLSAATNNYSMSVYVAGNFSHTAGTITETGGGTANQFIFNGSAVQTYTSGGTISNTVNFTVNSGATLQMAVASTTVSGAGAFTLSSGATLGVTSANGIVTGTTASGNIQVTGTRTYSAGANYIYNRTDGTQVTGNGLNQNLPANLTINNSSGVTLSAATSISGVLTMMSGNLTTTTTNLLTLTNTNSSAVSGGSATSFVNGPLKWTLPSNSTGVGTYVYPVGAGTVYRPFSLVNPSTGSGIVTAQVQTTTGNSGGTIDATLSTKSTTEYWTLTTTGIFTNSKVSAERPTAISPLNTLAGCATLGGTYTGLGGTVGTYGITNSELIGTNKYFVLAKGTDGIFYTPTSVSGLTYPENLGPSSSTAVNVGGYSLTDNIRIEALLSSGGVSCFEISTDNTNFSSVLTLPVVSQIVNPTPVYIRLKSGLALASYSSTVQLSSNGQTTKTIACSGSVTTGPSVATSVASVSGLTYVYSSSSSPSTTFTVSGSNLVDTVKVTPPTGYQVSTDGTNYYSSLNLNTAKSATLSVTTIYIRLALGMGVGSYNGNVVVSSRGATSKTITCSGTVTAGATLTTNTSFLGGFLYAYGTTLANSPAQKIKIYGSNLSGGITVTSANSTYFVVSKTLNGTYSNTVSYSASGSFLDSVYVKMNVGTSLTATNEYGPYAISFTSSGAVTKSVGCKGKVVAANTPSLYSSSTSLTGFGYQYGSGTPTGVMHGGPSSPQSVIVSGVSLTNPLVVDLSSTNFEVSRDPYSGYQSSLSLTPSSGVVLPTTIYVRLKSGLATGIYPGNINVSSSGASSALTVSLLSAQVYLSPLITATGSGSYCVGDTIDLTSSGDNISSQYWEGPNSYYSIIDDNRLTTNATTALTGNYIVTGNVLAGGNLIYNGSFEEGFVGFGSNYNYRDSTYRNGTGTNTYGALYYEGDYSILTIPHNAHTNFTYNGPKVGKKQMVVNGAPTAGVVIWSQSVAVVPGADYQFTYWEQTAELPNPSQLQLYINGVAAGPVYTASSTKGVWTQYLYNASAGSNSILNLELVNQNTIANGNDFALDDIQFKQVLVAKDTAAVVVGSNYPVSVALAASANPVNSGVPVTFTATPTNGGDTPTYEWYKNNVLISGATGATYTYEPANGDVVKCIMHSSLTCVTGNPANASVTMTVTTPTTVNYWVGTTSTNWGTASNWSANTIPASGDDVIYASTTNSYGTNAVRDLYLDQNRTIGNLINKTQRRLVIPAGLCLTVNSSITVVPQNGAAAQDLIYIYSSSATTANGSLIYHNSQENPVYGTVEMYSKATWNLSNLVNNKYNWQYFGIPVDGLIANPTFDKAYVRRWDETGTTIQNHWVQLSNDSTVRPFYGYEVCQSAAKTYVFKGKLVNRNFSSGQLAMTSGALYPGQHIFANPYTAAIDIKQLQFGSQTEQVIYQYNTGSFQSWTDVGGATGRGGYPGQYITSTPGTAGANGVPGQVPSMGSMLVKAMSVSSSATFAFNYATVVVANTDRQRVKSSDDSNGVVSTKVEVSSEYGTDCAWLFTHENCSSSFDNGWDAFKMEGVALQPQLYALGSDGNYQINATNDMNNTQLAFRPGSDTEYKLSFTHENTQRLYPNIYLVDESTKAVVDITNSGAEYRFTAQSTPSAVNRFRIVTRYYENNEPDFNKNIKIFAAKGAIFVHNMSKLAGEVAVYDISGHMIYRKTASPESIMMINSAVMPGAYVVKCVTSADDVAKRVIVQ